MLIIKNSCKLQCAYVNNSCSKEAWRERRTLKKNTRTSEKRENERTSCSKETWRERRTLKKDRRASEERENERKNGKKENEGRIFFIFPLFPTCSLQVLNGFPSSSQYVP
jgi:hypothetical protein